MQRYLIAALSLVMLTLPLNSNADEALDKARELLEKNDPVAAFAVLDPLAESREGEPDFDYLFGISALDAGYLTHAVFALERVLAVQPDNDVARAEIARAYFLLGERETAMQEFDTVRASGTAPAAAQETINRYLALLERAPGQAGDETTLISGWFDITGGYDTNINSGTDQSQIALPALGNVRFQLVDGATEQGSGFVQLAGNVNISHRLTDNIRAIGGARGFFRETESPFSTRDAYAYAGLTSEHGKHRFTVAGNYENYALDGDTLRNVYGGFGQWTYALDDSSRVNFSVQGSAIEYINIPTRDVDRYVFAAGYVKAFAMAGEPYVFTGVYGGFENERDSAFPQFGHDLYGGRVGANIGIFANTRVYASVAMEQRDYNGEDTIFLTRRDDTQLIANAGLEYEINRFVKIAPEISYINNDSNIPLSDYDRIVGSMRLRYSF